VPSSIDDNRAFGCSKVTASGPFLHFDNARPRLASDKYGMFGIERLSHPPYSPDMAPCDFWVFRYLNRCLEGLFFDDDIAPEGAVSGILMSMEHDMFVRVFVEWKHRLQQCVDHGGDYL
jgi:histone-lysine N-methyltransferase SETMAR